MLHVGMEALKMRRGNLRHLPGAATESTEAVVSQLPHAPCGRLGLFEVDKAVSNIPVGALIHRDVDEVVLLLKPERVKFIHKHLATVSVRNVADHDCSNRRFALVSLELRDEISVLRYVEMAQLIGDRFGLLKVPHPVIMHHGPSIHWEIGHASMWEHPLWLPIERHARRSKLMKKHPIWH